MSHNWNEQPASNPLEDLKQAKRHFDQESLPKPHVHLTSAGRMSAVRSGAEPYVSCLECGARFTKDDLDQMQERT